MNLKVGKFYKIVFEVGEKLLTYSCKILSIDGKFVSFEDRFGKILNYNINSIFSFEEIKEEEING